MVIVSPRTAHPIVQKYVAVPLVVSRLDPQEVGSIFKHTQNPFSFFPAIGLFSVEFALGYCNNMHYKRSENAPTANLSKTQGKK